MSRPETHATSRSLETAATACVYVVGMHRSGTSSIAGLLARLGLGVPEVGDLVPATRSNRHGHWESKRLVELNHRLLVEMGGTWSSPPLLEPGWEEKALRDTGHEARAVFDSAFARSVRPVVWKDPRLCLLLPFWRSVLEERAAAVFVYRDPIEVARSLEERDGIAITLGTALWERYVRAACSGLEGLPTLALDYGGVLEDPGRCLEEVRGFLDESGVATRPDREAAEAIDALSRRQGAAEPPQGWPGESAERLMEQLHGLTGANRPWRAPSLEPEPAWVGEVIAMRGEADSFERACKDVSSSRAFRLARRLRRAEQG